MKGARLEPNVAKALVIFQFDHLTNGLFGGLDLLTPLDGNPKQAVEEINAAKEMVVEYFSHLKKINEKNISGAKNFLAAMEAEDFIKAEKGQ